MLYVVMFGYGKGLAHWICNHIWLWEKTITFHCTYLKTNKVTMNLLKVGLTKNYNKQNGH
jgi:hypothetical protein